MVVGKSMVGRSIFHLTLLGASHVLFNPAPQWLDGLTNVWCLILARDDIHCTLLVQRVLCRFQLFAQQLAD